MRTRLVIWIGILGIGGLLLPVIAEAQGGGSISGLVSDSTGAVLPGATVEAASPVLIEGRITAVTDGAGRYTVVNLRPGTYKVTFTLSGFQTFVREDLVLTGDAALQVNAQMSVGALEQSITVSGQSPLVDVQQVRGQFVATREMMDVLPGANNFSTRALLIPGVRADTGGASVYWPALHGSTWRETAASNDGMRANMMIDDGQWQIGWEVNQAATAEMTFETAGAPAEVQGGGVYQNAIPKEGGNLFSGTWFTTFGHQKLGSSNADAALVKQIGVVNAVAYNYDTNPGFGGPIVKKKLWFFVALQRHDRKNLSGGQYFTGEGTPEDRAKNGFPTTAAALGCATPGKCLQAFTRNWQWNGVARITNQLSEKHKWRISFERLNNHWEMVDNDNTRPPESGDRIPQPLGYHAQARWTSTLTNKLLLEAGFAMQYNKWRREQFEWNSGSKSSYYNLADATWGGAFWITGHQPEKTRHAKASMSYVTGSHNLKAGFEHRWGSLGLDQGPIAADVRTYFYYNPFGDYNPTTNTGMYFPVGLEVLATPLGSFGANIKYDTGVYVQDKWTLDRWTFNLGARLDLFASEIPAQHALAGAWVPERSFPALAGPHWQTLVPRVGVAYDLFGNGRTALKATAHKYVTQESTTLAMRRNMMASFTWSARQEFRSWSDLDGNGSVLGPGGRIQYEEVGKSPNKNFASLADSAALDVDKRPGSWEFNGQVQHEVVKGTSVSLGYFRRNNFNLWYEDNAAQPHDGYDAFSVTGPVDPRLGSYSGQTLPLYSLKPDVYGNSSRVLTTSSLNARHYDGVEGTVNGRFKDGFFGASFTRERQFESFCEGGTFGGVYNKNFTLFCDAPRAWLTQFKAHVAYPVPVVGVMASGVLQGFPGPDILANVNVTSAQAGRTLLESDGSGAIQNLNVRPRETAFLPYQRKVDLRFTRRFKVGNYRLAPAVDIFNVFNANTTTTANYTCAFTAGPNGCGPKYLTPLTIMQARIFRFAMGLDW